MKLKLKQSRKRPYKVEDLLDYLDVEIVARKKVADISDLQIHHFPVAITSNGLRYFQWECWHYAPPSTNQKQRAITLALTLTEVSSPTINPQPQQLSVETSGGDKNINTMPLSILGEIATNCCRHQTRTTREPKEAAPKRTRQITVIPLILQLKEHFPKVDKKGRRHYQVFQPRRIQFTRGTKFRNG